MAQTRIDKRQLDADLADTTGDVYTGTHDFGGADDLEIPNSATPTVDTNGQVAIDTSVTDLSHGLLKYFGGEEMGVVAMPIAEYTTPTDGHVVAYNATNDEFELVAQSGGGGSSVAQRMGFSTNFEDVASRYLNITGTGTSISVSDNYLTFSMAGASSAQQCRITDLENYASTKSTNFNPFDYKIHMGGIFKFDYGSDSAGSPTDLRFYFTLFSNANNAADQSLAAGLNLGFIVDMESGGTYKAYTVSYDGTTTSLGTDVGSNIEENKSHFLEVVYTPATDIKFYIDGTLRNTKTTNLPTDVNTVGFGMVLGGKTAQTGAFVKGNMHVSNINVTLTQ